MKTALDLIKELKEDLGHHLLHEGETAQFKNRNGSWEDVEDRLAGIEEALHIETFGDVQDVLKGMRQQGITLECISWVLVNQMSWGPEYGMTVNDNEGAKG